MPTFYNPVTSICFFTSTCKLSYLEAGEGYTDAKDGRVEIFRYGEKIGIKVYPRIYDDLIPEGELHYERSSELSGGLHAILHEAVAVRNNRCKPKVLVVGKLASRTYMEEGYCVRTYWRLLFSSDHLARTFELTLKQLLASGWDWGPRFQEEMLIEDEASNDEANENINHETIGGANNDQVESNIEPDDKANETESDETEEAEDEEDEVAASQALW
jgi:hypothetical protein